MQLQLQLQLQMQMQKFQQFEGWSQEFPPREPLVERMKFDCTAL